MSVLYGNQVEPVQSSQKIFYLYAVHLVSSAKLNRYVMLTHSKKQTLTNCQNSKYIIYIASLLDTQINHLFLCISFNLIDYTAPVLPFSQLTDLL